MFLIKSTKRKKMRWFVSCFREKYDKIFKATNCRKLFKELFEPLSFVFLAMLDVSMVLNILYSIFFSQLSCTLLVQIWRHYFSFQIIRCFNSCNSRLSFLILFSFFFFVYPNRKVDLFSNWIVSMCDHRTVDTTIKTQNSINIDQSVRNVQRLLRVRDVSYFSFHLIILCLLFIRCAIALHL